MYRPVIRVIGSVLVSIAVVLMLCCRLSQAQPVGGNGPDAADPDASAVPRGGHVPGALQRVSLSCRGEAERFCPHLSGQSAPADLLMCLKYYKTDVSLGCRNAINAATH